jgi:hypothetical protein
MRLTLARSGELSNQLAALTERADATEIEAAKLQKALQGAAVARFAPARVIVDPQQEANAAMERAGKFEREGKFSEALAEYVNLYQRLPTARGSVDRQLVMLRLKSLANGYPPALAALRELRDTAMEKLRGTPDSRELVTEIVLLNERLDDGAASLALFDALTPDHPGRQALSVIAHKAFVAARRYADALVGKEPGAMHNELDMGIQTMTRQSPGDALSYRTFVIGGALSNIEVLTGAGRLDDARILTEKLLGFDPSDATRAAIKEHVERAAQPAASP